MSELLRTEDWYAICACAHGRDVHEKGIGACEDPDCDCARFEFDRNPADED